MTEDIRGIVVQALDRATGVLNTPDLAREIHGGRDVGFDRLQMDSLSLFEVIMEIEDRLGVELDADEVTRQGSLQGLVAHLQAMTRAT